MVFGNYRASIIVRCVVITLTAGLFFFLVFGTSFPFTTVIVGVLIPLQCCLLILSIDRSNRIWTHFFEAIGSAEFTHNYDFPAGKSFRKLKTEFTKVIDILKNHHVDREKQDHYLRTIAHHIGAALLIFKEDGSIDFCNEAFQTLFGVFRPRAMNELESVGAGLVGTLRGLGNGDKELLRIDLGGERLQLLVSVRDFILLGDKYRLASIQNIGQELEENEVEAWRNLARAITHEIMNSITPITSLASTANQILKKDALRSRRNRDLQSAIMAIEKRSRGLIHFVEDYRRFLRLPKPVIGDCQCRDLLVRVKNLMNDALRKERIDFSFTVTPRGLELSADGGLLEQALINLVLNSMEALHGVKKPWIKITAFIGERGRPVIDIADNGRGIAEDIRDKIFVPFFTTKKDGSGIGLSLCRQIMQMHGGTMSVVSQPVKRTVFSLKF